MTDAKEKSPQNNIETISESPYHGGLKYSAIVQILKEIPAGKVTTEKALVTYLREYYGLESLNINYVEFPMQVLRDEEIPFHRYLSDTGLLDNYYKEKAEAEGHILQEKESGKIRVVDYKESMVDLTQIQIPPINEAIGPCGSRYKNYGKPMLDLLKEEVSKRYPEK